MHQSKNVNQEKDGEVTTAANLVSVIEYGQELDLNSDLSNEPRNVEQCECDNNDGMELESIRDFKEEISDLSSDDEVRIYIIT